MKSVNEKSQQTQFILEAGVNHDASFDRAIQLIEAASQTGAEFIKFQTYTAKKIASKMSPAYWDQNEESTKSQFELFSKYDKFTRSEYFALAKHAEQLGLGFMTTCFDIDWVDQLDPIIAQYKIASADITNFQLISYIAEKNKPILLSTGAATFREIENALKVIRQKSNKPVAVLHCVLNYPTTTENAHLGRILALKEKFPHLEVGYSDHTKPSDSMQAIQIALDFGATIFEKHFTWNTEGVGNDHYHSFGLTEAKHVISQIKNSKLLSRYDEKEFLDCQKQAIQFARRGLYAAKNLPKGHVLHELDILPLRPPIGKDGFDGSEFFDVIGKVTTGIILEGDPFTHSNLQ